MTAWIPPKGVGLKMNVDVAVCPRQKMVGYGAVMHSNTGTLCFALAETGVGELDVFSAETVAILRGLLNAEELGFSNFAVEFDAQKVVYAINGEISLFSIQWGIIQEIKSVMTRLNINSLSYIPRD